MMTFITLCFISSVLTAVVMAICFIGVYHSHYLSETVIAGLFMLGGLITILCLVSVDMTIEKAQELDNQQTISVEEKK